MFIYMDCSKSSLILAIAALLKWLSNFDMKSSLVFVELLLEEE
jgi:hypothetical protein